MHKTGRRRLCQGTSVKSCCYSEKSLLETFMYGIYMRSVCGEFRRSPGKEVSCAPQRVAAEGILRKVQEHPDAWTRVDRILENSQSQQSKFFALQVCSTSDNCFPLRFQLGSGALSPLLVSKYPLRPNFMNAV